MVNVIDLDNYLEPSSFTDIKEVRDELINQWNFFNATFSDFDETKLHAHYQFNSILIDHGKTLNELDNTIEYTEDIVGSFENEVKVKADELRLDFPLIEKYVKEIRMIVAKEWIEREYKRHEQQKQLSHVDTTSTSTDLI